jgi:hypothetical protein
MRVFCYYEKLEYQQFAAEHDLVDRWCDNWFHVGWSPHVLQKEDAVVHPLYEWFTARMGSLPTVNKPEYELAAFVRWLALAQRIGQGETAVMTDYDVCNLGFKPVDATRLADPGRPVNLDSSGCGGPFIVNDHIAHAIPAFLVATAQLTRNLDPCHAPHWSDMEVWNDQFKGGVDWLKSVPVSIGYGDKEHAPLMHIHWVSALAYKKSKTQIMDGLLKG